MLSGYTKFAHFYSDFIAPTLAPAERDCMNYIIRRTEGFTDGQGGRKERDTISISQFVNGIRINDVVLDLGTQLSKNTVKRALEGLEAKGLVEVRWACTNCFWEQQRGDPPPPLPEDSKSKSPAPQCPRCKRTLSRSWARSTLTKRRIVELLNDWSRQRDAEREPHNRENLVFAFDKARDRITVRSESDERAWQLMEQARREEIDRLEALLWYPHLAKQIVKQAEDSMAAGNSVASKRIIEEFYAPIIKLQEDFANMPLIEMALTQTIRKNVFAGRKGSKRTWINYTRAIAANHAKKYGNREPSRGETNAQQRERQSPEAMERSVVALLERAAELNGRDQRDEARQLLSDILSDQTINALAPLLDGDKSKVDHQLRLAFKHGTSDFRGVTHNPWGLDFMPEYPPDAPS